MTAQSGQSAIDASLGDGREAIERYGAIVIRIDGEYEASVARARESAGEEVVA